GEDRAARSCSRPWAARQVLRFSAPEIFTSTKRKEESIFHRPERRASALRQPVEPGLCIVEAPGRAAPEALRPLHRKRKTAKKPNQGGFSCQHPIFRSKSSAAWSLPRPSATLLSGMIFTSSAAW